MYVLCWFEVREAEAASICRRWDRGPRRHCFRDCGIRGG